MHQPSRHHVMWHGEAKVFGQCIGIEWSSVSGGIDYGDVLSNLRIVDAEGHGIEQALESPRVLFDLCRTDSEAVGLDHRVHSRKEVEITFLIAPHEVARK